MLNRKVALDFLTTVLWSMMCATECDAGHTEDQAHGIILDVEPLLDQNKVQAIKTLRDWVNNRVNVVLPSSLGVVMKEALRKTEMLYEFSPSYLLFGGNKFNLKEAKDFIDVMDVVLHATEPKAF